MFVAVVCYLGSMLVYFFFSPSGFGNLRFLGFRVFWGVRNLLFLGFKVFRVYCFLGLRFLAPLPRFRNCLGSRIEGCPWFKAQKVPVLRH